MKDPYDTDVLICGAGAAGLTLAIDLARRGIAYRLVDKIEQPFGGSRGKGIQPRTQEIFEDLGILDRVAAAGGCYPPERQYKPDGSWQDAAIVEQREPTASEPYGGPLMVPQYLTEGVMRERLLELGGGQPQYGTELIGFEQDADGVTVRLAGAAGEERLRVRWLVGADGGRSFVRSALGIGFPGKTLGVRAIVADVVLDGLSRDAWHRFGDGDMSRQLAICPLAGTELFQIQCPIPLDGEVDLSAGGLERLVAQRSGRSDIRIHSVSWASAYTMNARLAERYRMGRVFLAGDAAHIHPPTGGQGLNTSVQDAYNLGWKLAAACNGAPDSLLDSYEEERRPVAAEMLGMSTRLLDAAHKGDMRRGREVHQLDIGYRGSSLALDQAGEAVGLRAGDRAPDAPVRGAGGQATRMFDLFRGPHWTLLAHGVDRHRVQPRAGLHVHGFGAGGDLVDDGGYFEGACAVAAAGWILVRPDGYVGAIVPGSEIAALERYFDRVGLPVPAMVHSA